MTVKTVKTKSLQFVNTIYVDDVKTMIQSYSIDTENGKLTKSQPILNQDLYKANKEEIRSIVNTYEDVVFAEQDEILATLSEDTIESVEKSDDDVTIGESLEMGDLEGDEDETEG